MNLSPLGARPLPWDPIGALHQWKRAKMGSRTLASRAHSYESTRLYTSMAKRSLPPTLNMSSVLESLEYSDSEKKYICCSSILRSNSTLYIYKRSIWCLRSRAMVISSSVSSLEQGKNAIMVMSSIPTPRARSRTQVEIVAHHTGQTGDLKVEGLVDLGDVQHATLTVAQERTVLSAEQHGLDHDSQQIGIGLEGNISTLRVYLREQAVHREAHRASKGNSYSKVLSESVPIYFPRDCEASFEDDISQELSFQALSPHHKSTFLFYLTYCCKCVTFKYLDFGSISPSMREDFVHGLLFCFILDKSSMTVVEPEFQDTSAVRTKRGPADIENERDESEGQIHRELLRTMSVSLRVFKQDEATWNNIMISDSGEKMLEDASKQACA
ncbi:hypothetical protein GOODEAATRI_023041 [Goodea atripinnis]|uniref:Uncharacterized protein n=1 Tax=Goodea atripinnis TaxID=208336 RepID=A0ABV0NCZ6_9TELE